MAKEVDGWIEELNPKAFGYRAKIEPEEGFHRVEIMHPNDSNVWRPRGVAAVENGQFRHSDLQYGQANLTELVSALVRAAR